MNNKTNECLQKINDLIECLKNDIFRSKTQLEKEMDEAFANTSLSEKPDFDKINDLVCQINEMVIKQQV